MKALIDGDILLYLIGSATDDEGNPLSWPLTFARLKGKIDQIVRDVGADEFVIYITGEGNFREEEATIKPYKGNRNAPKPHHYQKIKDYFRKTKDMEVVWCEGYEADDGMSMEQYLLHIGDALGTESDYITRQTVICSLDKDLRMVPGNHFEWSRTIQGKEIPSKYYFVDKLEGQRWFFQQLLMGDSTDNILGLFGVGKKSTLVTAIDKIYDTQDMYNHVQKHYEDRFGSYWEMFMHENARLLWMLRSEDDDIRKDLMKYEGFRQLYKEEKF